MIKKHKNEIFLLLKDCGISLEDFKTGEQPNAFYIRYKGTRMSFVIKHSDDCYEAFQCFYTPFSPSMGLNGFYPYEGYTTFQDIISKLKNWINNDLNAYINEQVDVDLWEEHKNGNKIFDVDKIDFTDKAKFSIEEKQQVIMGINELKLLIHQSFKTTTEQQVLVNDRLDYLIEAVERSNKFDWKGIAVSTLLSIATTLTLDTTQGQKLFDLFKQVLSNLPKLIPH